MSQRRVSNHMLSRIILVVVVTAALASPARAGITASEHISPAYDSTDPWSIPGDLIVGYDASATLGVSGTSGVIVSGASVIGSPDSLGILAIATLTNPGATWTTSDLLVGPHAEGQMTVSDGAILTSGQGQIGGRLTWNGLEEIDSVVSGMGTLTVTGPGSQWDNTWLLVGVSGSGTLAIADGAAVTTGGESDSSAIIGLMRDGTGTVTADGADTSWSVDQDIVVGAWGEGFLTVSGGAQVDSYNGWVGGGDASMWGDDPYLAALGDANGPGTATITGSGSQWNVGNQLVVGAWGTGELTIADQGQVTAGDVYIGGMPTAIPEGEAFSRDMLADGFGSVTVTGEGSALNVMSETTLFVGYSGVGVLDVNAGGDVVTPDVVVGGAPDAVGRVTVSGSGSTLTSERMEVGAWGAGALTVSGGGEVSTGDLMIGGFDVGGVDDLPPEVLADFGGAHGTGTVAVTGPGSVLGVSGAGPLYVGYSGVGTLDINDAGQVHADAVVLGAGPNAVGTTTVDGPGSSLYVSWDTVVGAWGQGNLTISNGGYAETSGLYIGGLDVNEAGLDPDLLAELGDANGIGEVTVTGEDSSLEVYGDETLVVGAGGTGTLTVSDGGAVTSVDGYIGGYLKWDYNDVSGMDTLEVRSGAGSAQVTGEGSTWQTEGLVVGTGGPGTLEVSNGGRVESSLGIIGFGPDSTGTATVTGPNSVWANYEGSDFPYYGTMVVGAWGDGQLTVSNGGQVETVTMYIGGLDVSEIDDGNTESDLDDPAGTGVVTVTGDGSTLRVMGGNTTYVGYSGTGTLEILDGGQVVSDAAIVGVMEGSSGLVRVDGNDSTWSIVGGGGIPGLSAQGDGEVIISNRGLVDVNGADALLDVAGDITVGSEGTGSRMTISNGGLVRADSLDVGGIDPEFDTLAEYFDPGVVFTEGTGAVTVTGIGSSLEAESLIVGFAGSGTLDINDGASVTSQTAFLGVIPDATGTAEVANGSTWNAGENIVVGLWGQGDLTISGGSEVTTNEMYIGGTAFEMVAGEEEEYNRDLLPDGTGAVTVTGPDSTLNVSSLATLYVGYSGNGTLDVNDGGYVESVSAGIGVLPGSTGAVTVDGVHSNEPDIPSQWYNGNSMFVGGYGAGSLTISNGGVVDVLNTLYIGGFDPEQFAVDTETIGYDPNGAGTVTVTGEGSTLYGSGLRLLYVGYSGNGTLDINDGGYVESSEAGIGVLAGSTGAVTVSGAASAWDNYGSLYLGYEGNGTLLIEDGARVAGSSPDTAYIGWGADSTGAATVTGAGSQWIEPGTMYVGYDGAGTLSIAAGGQVSAQEGFIGTNTGSTGAVTVTGAESQWTIANNLYVGYDGTGSLDVNDGGQVVVDGSLYIGGDVEGSSGAGTLMTGSGSEVEVGHELYVWETGTLGGAGTITVREPTTLYNYGTIAPGDDGIGTLAVNGSVVFEEGSTYAVDINNTTADKLQVDGGVTINGGTVQVSSRGTVVGEHDYEIINADNVDGTFDVLDTALLHFSVSEPNLDYNDTSVWLHLVAANFDDPNIARTPNERAVAGALQVIADEGGNGVTDGLQDLETPEDLRGAYDQLAGQSRPPLAPLTIAGTSRFLGTVTSRMQTIQTGLVDSLSDSGLWAMSGPDSSPGNGRMYDVGSRGQTIGVGNGTTTLGDQKWGLWGRGYGLFGSRDTENDVPGYSYDVYGGSFGLDYQFTEALLGGVVVGMSDGDVDFEGSSDNTDFEARHIGLYGSAAWNRWYIDSVATFADLSYDTERFVDLLSERLTGSFDGYELSAYAEVGLNCQLRENLRLQPLASLQYTYLNLDGYTESGGASALSYDDQTHESVKGSLGARLTRTLIETADGRKAEGQLRGRWVHEFGDNQSQVDASFASAPAAVFTVEDEEIARDSAVLGVGLSGELTKHTRVYVDYDARLNSDESVQVISAALQYRW